MYDDYHLYPMMLITAPPQITRFIRIIFFIHCFMRFLHEPFQGKGHFAFRLLLPSRAAIKAFVLRALRPDLTEINGAFHLPFYTSSHFAKVINGGSGGIIWE